MPRASSTSNPSARTQPYRKGSSAITAAAKSIDGMETNQEKAGASNPKGAKSGTSWRIEQDLDSDAPIFFWKPHQPWGFFSQWCMVPFTDPTTGMAFNCNEQYMMYHKALTFNDSAIAAKVMASQSPREHKALGKRVKGFTDEEWKKVSFQIVLRANFLKFRQGSALDDDVFVYSPDGLVQGQEKVTLRELLMSTGDRELVEASTFDRIWGIGYSQSKAASAPREKWGKNWLGKVLMEVRKTLREENEVGNGPLEESSDH